jgi:hypothetical protein
MSVKIGDKFKRRNFVTTTLYEVYDITGSKQGIPSDAVVVYLKVVNRAGWFNAEPFCIAVPERSLGELFEL